MKKQAEQGGEEEEYSEEQQNEFKAYRRFMFLFGKGLKYTLWAISAAFLYHFYLVMKKDKPEEGLGASEPLLTWAFTAKGFYEFIRDLLTKPPVNSLLMERPPVPPGY